jgi:erythromycin esterase
MNEAVEIDYDLLKDYLINNNEMVTLSDTNTTAELRLLDSITLKRTQMFLIGENHAAAINTQFEFFFICYLHKYAGVNYIFQECPVSAALFENRYLETGDTLILDSLFSQFRGTLAWTKERYEFIKKIRNYNLKQPDNKKLTFVGVDIEHQHLTPIRYIASVSDTAKAPPEISSDLKQFIALKDSNWKDSTARTKAVASLYSKLINYQSLSRQYFSSDFLNVQLVLENMMNATLVYSNKKNIALRDSCMYATFLKIYPALTNARFFGQWGQYHINQGAIDKVFPLAAWLNNEKSSPVRDKICSITILYKDCSKMNPKTFMAESFSNFDDPKGIFDQMVQNGPAIFKLNNGDSPFNLHFIPLVSEDRYSEFYGVTTQYYQYYLYIKNSSAEHPLGQ